MADGPFNPVSPFISASSSPPNNSLQSTRAPSLQLLNLPSEILGLIFQQITDLHSLLACRQTCSHLYEIYDSNRAPCNTRATLDALTKRGIECRQPCLFAQVVMKHHRPPSMYLEPALLALRHGRSDLCQRFCRALLGLRYFVGYDEDAQYAPGRSGWTYREVTDWEASSDTAAAPSG